MDCGVTQPARPDFPRPGVRQVPLEPRTGALVGSGSGSAVFRGIRELSLPGQLRLKFSGPLDRGDDLFRGGVPSLDGHTCFLFDPICGCDLDACKPFQGLFHFFLATPSGHARDGKHQLVGLSHLVLLVCRPRPEPDEILTRLPSVGEADSSPERTRGKGVFPFPLCQQDPACLDQAAQKGPYARRSAMGRVKRTQGTLQRVPERNNAADGPVSVAC